MSNIMVEMGLWKEVPADLEQYADLRFIKETIKNAENK